MFGLFKFQLKPVHEIPEGNIFHKTIGMVTKELMEQKFKPFMQ